MIAAAHAQHLVDTATAPKTQLGHQAKSIQEINGKTPPVPGISPIQPYKAPFGQASVMAPVIPEPDPEMFPFTPDFPTWPGDLAYTASDYILLDNAKNQVAATTASTSKALDPFKDPAKPLIFLTPRVYKIVNYIVERMAPKTGECAFMFLVKALSPNTPRHVLLYDVFLAAQDATMATVDLDLEHVAKIAKDLQEEFPDQLGNMDMASQMAHGHSHGNMPTFNSGTDVKQQESKTELGFQCDHRFFLIFNAQKQITATMVIYSPIFHRVENVSVGIYTGPGVAPCTDLTREQKADLDKQMDSLIKAPYRAAATYGTPYNYLTANKGLPKPWAQRNRDAWDIDTYDYEQYMADNYGMVYPKTAPRRRSLPASGQQFVGADSPLGQDLVASLLCDMCGGAMEDEALGIDIDLEREAFIEHDTFKAVHASSQNTPLHKVETALKEIGFFENSSFESVTEAMTSAIFMYEDVSLAGSAMVVDIVPTITSMLENIKTLADLLLSLDELGILSNMLEYAELEDADITFILFATQYENLWEFLIDEHEEVVEPPVTPADSVVH